VRSESSPPGSGGLRFADLFSGGGGMSHGFHVHPAFTVVGAADAQIGKPSSPVGSLSCNSTYALNMGVEPVHADLGDVEPRWLRRAFGLGRHRLDVLAVCPPCTGFTRTRPTNHRVDDDRNSLVSRTADFVIEFRPRVLIMENAREFLSGKFAHHFQRLGEALRGLGYTVATGSHLLTDFGLPQIRERALVVAAEPGLRIRTLDELWGGAAIIPDAKTVRRTIGHLPALGAGVAHQTDPAHVCPAFGNPRSAERLRAIPPDGGSWRDLWDSPALRKLLNPAMLRAAARADWGCHPDVYGRMWWDRPAPTVKRECGHVGNGRYAHPEQHRLLSLREMALLNGFPAGYRFGGRSLANRYRHVGDAVPPLISHQLAWLAHWIITGTRPALAQLILPGCNLRPTDIRPAEKPAAA